jgi:hypothetical protein
MRTPSVVSGMPLPMTVFMIAILLMASSLQHGELVEHGAIVSEPPPSLNKTAHQHVDINVGTLKTNAVDVGLPLS